MDSLFQGFQNAGTQNVTLSSQEYLSNAARTLNNIEVSASACCCVCFCPDIHGASWTLLCIASPLSELYMRPQMLRAAVSCRNTMVMLSCLQTQDMRLQYFPLLLGD